MTLVDHVDFVFSEFTIDFKLLPITKCNRNKEHYVNFLKLALTTPLISMSLLGCNTELDESQSTSSIPQVTTKVFSQLNSCSAAVDVPNCAFEKGIYVVQIGPNVAEAQRARVERQVRNFLNWAHEDVRKLWSEKRVVLGVMDKEPSSNATHDQFVLALAKNMTSSAKNIDAIELVYSHGGDASKDETQSTTAYQKLMQLFDYYVDGSSPSGVQLELSYQGFKYYLNHEQTGTFLKYDECNYGNGQLTSIRALGTKKPCISDGKTTDEDGNDISNGKIDPIHQVKANLNPGALLGSLYEYKIDPVAGKYPGELKEPNPSFTGVGKVASGDTTSIGYPYNWANPAFHSLNSYLNTWFFANKS